MNELPKRNTKKFHVETLRKKQNDLGLNNELKFMVEVTINDYKGESLVNKDPKHEYSNLQPSQKVLNGLSYTEYPPILIDDESDFASFPGQGTYTNPYRIEGYNITDNTAHLIEIRTTQAYFRINNCLLNGLDGSYIGIYLYNMGNGTINSTIIHNCEVGIYGFLATNNTLTNNLIYDTNDDRAAISLYSSKNNIITNNNITRTSYVQEIGQYGIDVGQNSHNTIVSGNTISNFFMGFHFAEANNLTVTGNTVFNSGRGMNVGYLEKSKFSNNEIYNIIAEAFFIAVCQNNSFTNNTIYNCKTAFDIPESYGANNNTFSNNIIYENTDGLRLSNCHNSSFFNNSIYNNSQYGFYFYEIAANNTIFNNTIYNNSKYGIYLKAGYEPSYNNTVKWNNLIDNNPGGTSQAFDDGIINTFAYNFWNEWISPDDEPDGIVDIPYSIDGSAINNDSYPLVSPNPPVGIHILTNPTVVYPNGGETVSDTINIQWSAAIDYSGHTINYTINYSMDGGTTWTQLVEGLTSTQYPWDTNTVSDGPNYLIKVIVLCSEGQTAEDISETTFRIRNTPHSLSIPTVVYPNGEEILDGTVTIQWTAATDSWDHSVNYSVYYSADAGSTWAELVSGWDPTSYSWDTTPLADNDTSMIRVNATCSEGLITSDSSNTIFTIRNTPHSLSIPTVEYPNGGETLDGTVTIQWTAAIDSWEYWGHTINYTINYSIDGGIIWTQLVEGVTSTQYAWDTNKVTDGSSYLIKVIALCSEGLTTEDISDTTFTIRNTPPSITGPPDFDFDYGETGYSILWSASDPNPANYIVFCNNSVYDQSIWISTIIVSLSLHGDLEVGIHNFTCVVESNFGLQASNEVWVTVNPAAPDTTAPTISSPADISFEETSIGYSIIWSGEDNRAPWWAFIWKNSTLNYSQAWIGNDIEISLEGLAANYYVFNCTLVDEAGNFVYDLVYVTVSPQVPDTDPPSITTPATLMYEERTTGNTLTWECFDAHPYAYEIDKDTTKIIYAPWHGENITINIDNLPIGSWVYNLTLWDISGNSRSRQVTVIVTPSIPDTTPPTISEPAEQTITENMRGTIIWEVFDDHPSVFIISKNGTIVFPQSHWSSGIIQYSFTPLPLGTWKFTLTLWDEAGNSTSRDALVHVLIGSAYDTILPQISHHPDLEIIFGTTNNTIIIFLFDEHPQGYCVYLNDTKISEADWIVPNIQVSVSVDGLAIGSYNVKISAWDVYGNEEYQEVGILVYGDNIPPEIDSPADVTLREQSSYTLTWHVSDDNPDRFEIINQSSGSIIKQGSWIEDQIEFNLENLAHGTYYLRCIVYDRSGNYAYDDVVVTIKEDEGVPGYEILSTLFLISVLVLMRKFSLYKRRFLK